MAERERHRRPWRRYAQLMPLSAEEVPPVFLLKDQRPWPGWNMLELEVEGEISHGLAKVLMETRRGCVEVGVPLRVGKTAKRLVYVPFGVRRITLQAVCRAGPLRVRQLRWVWLTPWFAHDRLARRLGNVHPDYRGLSPSSVIRALHRESVAQGRSWRRLALQAYASTFARACAHHDYRQWVRVVEPRVARPPEPEKASAVRWQHPQRPLFSLLMPLQGGSEQVLAKLRASLESLLGQAYAHWELYVALSPGLDDALGEGVRELCAPHGRVRLLEGRSRGLEALSHQAFVAADGEGVMWLTPGDRLASSALHRLALAWNHHPKVQLFYADEDTLNDEGQRSQPRFKPAWNPDLLMSGAYIGRPALYRRNLLWRLQAYRQIGEGLAEQATPALLDYAWALRFLAWQTQRPAAEPPAVLRIPQVLYHRHQANAVESPPELARFTRLVQQLLPLLPGGAHARATGTELAAATRVRWPLPDPAPLVSLLVPTRDGVEVLRPCIDTLLETTEYRHFELLILDNQSRCPQTLGYLEAVVRRDSRVRVLRWPHPFNYSAINNFGVHHARGDLIGLVNNDIEPLNGEWLTEMVSQANRPEIGCVGAKLFYPQGAIQHAGVMLGVGGVAGHAHRFFPANDDGYTGRLKLVQNLSAVTAACLLVRRELYEQVGGLNELNLGVAFNDVDFCLRVQQAGYRNLWTPYAELIHHESATRHAPGSVNRVGQEGEEAAFMRRTWGKQLLNDPAYNPNLTRLYEDFSLR